MTVVDEKVFEFNEVEITRALRDFVEKSGVELPPRNMAVAQLRGIDEASMRGMRLVISTVPVKVVNA